MAPTSKHEAQRTVVRQLWVRNVRKPTEIIHLTGYPKSTVYDLVSQLKKRSDVTPLYKSGRPPILTSKNRRHLGLLVQNNKAITAAEMTEKLIQKNPDLKVSVRTVQRTLKKNLRLEVCRPLSAPLLQPHHIEARLKWAEKYRRCNWSNVIFSDETTFQMFRNTQLVRYRRGETRPHRSMVKHPYKVHAWGAFTARGPISLILFTENFNSDKYLEILEAHLFPYISRTHHKLRFQQDNSPVHKAGKIIDLFESRGVRILDWPAYSPDINPIENLWAILKDRVEKESNLWLAKKKKFSNNDFQDIIRQEWEGISEDLFLTLANSMKNRVSKVIERDGKKIDY